MQILAARARHGNLTPAQVRAAQSQVDQNAMADLKLAD
jgi:hypothetical protein